MNTVIGVFALILFISLQVNALSTETKMRVAIVTGANKGIGKEIASQLATSGIFSDVILACRDKSRGLRAVAEISSLPNACKVACEPLTIGDTDSHQAFCDSIATQYDRIDVLVNNAGMAFKAADPTPFQGQCKPTLDVNFRGTVDFTEKMLPLVRRGDDARIVNVASMAGHLGQIRSEALREKFSDDNLTKEDLGTLVDQFEASVKDGTHLEKGWGNSNYGLSKLALIAMTKVWAREEPNIKVNCCCPGYCDTDMTSHKGPRSAADGARNAVIPAIENVGTGEYYSDYAVASW